MILPIANGEPRASWMAKAAEVIELGLGPGAADGIETLGDTRALLNQVAAAFGRDGFADGASRALVRARINALMGGPAWVPDGASAYWDFVNGHYWGGAGMVAPICDRDSGGLALGSDSRWSSFGADTLRRTDLGLTVEAAGAGLLLQNADVESSAWGKEAGLAPSAGAAGPIVGRTYTTLTRTSGNGRISQTLAVVAGAPHSVVFIGRGTPTYRYAIMRNNVVASAAYRNYVFDAQTLTVKAQGAGAANSRISALADGFVMASVDLTAGFSGVVGWYFYFSNVEPVGDAFQAPTVAGSWDFAYADALSAGSTPILSGAVAGARAADSIPLELPAGVHDLTVTFDDDSTQLLTGKAGSFVIPTNLSRRTIKTILAVAA